MHIIRIRNIEMKKFIMMVLAMAAVAVAGVKEPFKQFTQADYTDYGKPGQDWSTANMFTLKVHGGSDVWLSNYVRSWYEPIADLHGNVYDMGVVKYGYIYKDDMTSDMLANGSYVDKIHWSDGATTDITYTDGIRENTATGYLLDYFENDAEVYLVMTTLPSDSGETVDTYQYVADADNETSMASRQHNTLDIAGNVRVNFGIDSEAEGRIGREFVAVYDDTAYIRHTAPAGGPLPGLVFVGLLSVGTIFGASRLKKREAAL